MDDIRTFVKTKYSIISIEDESTWGNDSNYPDLVKSEWAWRIFDDVAGLITSHKDSISAVAMATSFRGTSANIDSLESIYSPIMGHAGDNAEIMSAWIAYDAVHINHYKDSCGKCASEAAFINSLNHIRFMEDSYKLYENWLFEELCKWESSK
jgi:hypothetical protein